MRRKARVVVLKVLYSEEFNTSSEELLLEMLKSNKLTDDDRKFAKRLLSKTKESKANIDEIIKEHLKNWNIKRLSKIDLNIIRIALSEIMEFPETPVKVVINESIEIAKIYGSSKSPKFINGILDSILKRKGYL